MRALLLLAFLPACGHASADATTAATPPPAPTATQVAVSTPAPTPVAGESATTVEALLADPAKNHGLRVHVKGTLNMGFEVSNLDGKAWIRVGKYEGFPDGWRKGPVGSAQVEAWGTLETQKGRYGHLGKYKAHLDAERVVYLGPALGPATK